jgi:alkanesulfonate monooxygenase
MTLTFDWFLPTNGGDGRQVLAGGHGVASGPMGRPASLAYLGQVARSAEQLGFDAALTPTGAWCEDAWVSTAMLAGLSERLRFLVAFRPGLTSPTLAAQMASTFQTLTGGRLLLNVVTGGEDAEQRAHGDFLDKDGRYARCDEFLTIVRDLWAGETVNFHGEHLRVDEARLQHLPGSVPAIYFGGSSPAAGRVAAKHADVYLTWGEPPAAVAEKIEWIRGLAADQGREVRFGIRMHTISRDSASEAWSEADRLLEDIDDETVERVQAGLRRSGSEGQRRMLELNRGTRDGLEVYPNLWAGVGLVRGGAGTALVGSHEQVAERIEEYHRLGIDEFVLSGYPHLEESYRFGEGVLPILAARGLWTNPVASHPRASVPSGATTAAS